MTTTQESNSGAGEPSALTDGIHLLIDALKLNGIHHIYGLPGIPITDLTRKAQAAGLRVFSFRHEQNAGYAASIAGFLTKQPGVCLTVSAPGFLNGLTALAHATTNCFPMIPSGAAHTDMILYGDHVAGTMDDAAKAKYRRFLGKLYAPRLKRLGFDPRVGAYAGQDPEISQQREQIVRRLAGTGRDAALRQTLIEATRSYLNGDAKALDPAWYDMAFSVWIDQGGLAAAKDLAQRALASQDPLLRPQALEAVASSGSAGIAKWVLDEFKDDRLRKSERLNLIRSVILTGGTRDMGFDWLKTNYDQLTKGGGGIFFSARLPGMVGGFCSVARANEVAALLRPQLQGKTGSLDLERTIERIRSCGVLKDARSAEVSAALKKLG